MSWRSHKINTKTTHIKIGIPCGILSASIGLNALQVFLMCALFYSGAGQFMIPNMWLAGNPLLSIIASVSLVNTRQMLYGASLSRFCDEASRRAAFLFGATVTDESFGVNLARFESGTWDVRRATFVNLCSQTSWGLSCVAGTLVGQLVDVPTAIASFAMTAIFVCLLCMQKVNVTNAVTVFAAVAGVYLCKLVGLSGPAILLGALAGMACGYAHYALSRTCAKQAPQRGKR